MNSKLRLLCISFAALLIGCGKPDTLVTDGYDQAEMDAAIKKAQGSVDEFIAELKSPTGESHAVKKPVKDGDQVEHFWLTPVTYSDGVFTGTINNDPGMVGNVKLGDEVTVAKEEISDWMYMKDDKMYGNFTMRPLLKTLPEAEAEAYRKILANP